MSHIFNDYTTANVVPAPGRTDYLFFPRGKPVEGCVRVNIATRVTRPSSPQRHPKIAEALRLASQFHPNHAVSVRLEGDTSYHCHHRGREFFQFRLV